MKLVPDMREIFYRLSLAVLPPAYVLLSRLWFSTCRLTIRDKHFIDEAQEHGAVIVPFWHYSLFYIFYHVSRYPAVALISASRDGEYIARIAQRLDFETIRGSSNRQGVQALKKLLKAMRAGKHVGIVADGSQGPARRLQPGTVFLASKTGAPILPMVWATEKFKVFKSWDRTVLPMPFSRIILRYGEPVFVPAGLDPQGLEEHRHALEQNMNNLYTLVWSEFGREQHDEGPGEVDS